VQKVTKGELVLREYKVKKEIPGLLEQLVQSVPQVWTG
jgi:hypothetical protein